MLMVRQRPLVGGDILGTELNSISNRFLLREDRFLLKPFLLLPKSLLFLSILINSATLSVNDTNPSGLNGKLVECGLAGGGTSGALGMVMNKSAP